MMKTLEYNKNGDLVDIKSQLVFLELYSDRLDRFLKDINETRSVFLKKNNYRRINDPIEYFVDSTNYELSLVTSNVRVKTTGEYFKEYQEAVEYAKNHENS